MAADSFGFDAERQRLARELFTTRLRFGIARSAGFGIAILVFLLSGASAALRDWAGDGPWWTVFVYFSVLYFVLWIAGLPFSVIGHRLEVRYGLSRQTWRGWGLDDAKSLAIGYGLTLVAAEVLYWLLREFPATWWVIVWVLGLGVSVAASVVAPVVFLRLFYKSNRLDNPELEARFRALAERAGMRVLGVHVVQSSVKSSRSNAALAGAGRTRRIVLTDTLLKTHEPDEIETILAHELAHQKHRDPAIGFGLFVVTSLVSLAVLQAVLPWAVSVLGLRGIADVAGLPVLMLATGILSLAFDPLERALSRWRESRADRTALEITGKPEAFASAMVKLHDANLSLARPPRLIEFLLMRHPAAWRRVSSARAFPGRALK
jgi:STE24 endopeptidase